MAVSQLDITNVINISVSQSTTALSAFNTSNLALFTPDTPNGTFPASGIGLYLNATDVGKDFGTSSLTYAMAVGVFSQAPNLLAGGGYLAIITLLTSETMDAAISRTRNLVSYYGCMNASIMSQADTLAAAAVAQANNMVAFFVQKTAATFATGGLLDLLRSGSFNKSRGLAYLSAADKDALVYMASYAGRAMSVNFNGNNTTATMHLKQLAGVQPDPALTQTNLNAANLAGVDMYPSIQGVPVVFTSGANKFWDQIYNLGWFVGALQVAGFNYLAGASTKIPQTENGMDGLKGAYAQVLGQAVTNGYAAPGIWTSPTTFGNQADLLSNVSQIGWYMYSVPVAQQSVASRVARSAPLVQIALKEAGAMHSSSVIVNINA